MNKSIIDEQTFKSIISTAISASAEVFNAMRVELINSEQLVRREYLGKTFSDKFDKLPEEVQKEAKRVICLEAFYIAIPSLDLVLTSTGFGVVSNSNVAPASKERVSSLSARIKNNWDNAVDELLISLHTLCEDWHDESVAKYLINSLFWTARDLRKYAGMPDAYRTDLLKSSSVILEAEEIFRTKISSVYFDSLVCAVRTNDISDDNALIIQLLRLAIGAYLGNSLKQFSSIINRVINILEDNADKYPIYQSSEAYKVKHFKYYENEQEHTTFFWG